MSEEKLSAKLQKIVDAVKELSLIEVSDLVKAMEEEFGVSAAAPMMMGAMPAAAAAELLDFVHVERHKKLQLDRKQQQQHKKKQQHTTPPPETTGTNNVPPRFPAAPNKTSASPVPPLSC